MNILQVECANGKGINENITHDLKINHKIDVQSMHNRCRIYALKSDARMMETGIKIDPKDACLQNKYTYEFYTT